MLWKNAGRPTLTHANSDGRQIVNTTQPTRTERKYRVKKRPDGTSYRMLAGTHFALKHPPPPPSMFIKNIFKGTDAWREGAKILDVPRDEVKRK